MHEPKFIIYNLAQEKGVMSLNPKIMGKSSEHGKSSEKKVLKEQSFRRYKSVDNLLQMYPNFEEINFFIFSSYCWFFQHEISNTIIWLPKFNIFIIGKIIFFNPGSNHVKIPMIFFF